MTEAEFAFENEPCEEDVFSSGWYDTEYGDEVPDNVYENGMYLGDGVLCVRRCMNR